MNDREEILARIREALARPALLPGSHAEDSTEPRPEPRTAAAQARDWLPPVDDSWEGRLERFKANALELKAAFFLLENTEELGPLLRRCRTQGEWKRIASHRGELTDTACALLDLPVLRTDQPYAVDELERCDAAITECDALVAQTGSVLVTNRSAGGRSLSVLPPHHLVLARREQLVADLPTAFALLPEKYGDDYPSMISFITGPSRTGDIERILVLGAHGPKNLTIICL